MTCSSSRSQPKQSVDLDDLLERRSAAVRAHDAKPCADGRAALIAASIAFRRAQGWGADRIVDEVNSHNHRLNRVFGDQHHA